MTAGYDLAPVLMAAQFILLLVHQLDSFREREWELAPLGQMKTTPRGFVWGTVVLLALQLSSMAFLLARPRARAVVVITWGAVGLVVPLFHTIHYLFGDKKFRGWRAAAVIYLTGVVSFLLVVAGVD